MNVEKWALKSKTILGILMATLAMWAPQLGIDFTNENGSVIIGAWNEVLASGFAIFAAYGRVVADSKVYITKK